MRGISNRFAVAVLSAILLIATTTTARAENWPQWRGPAYNGSSTETGLPDVLSLTDTLAWSAELPGGSAGTPVVWGGCVFVSSLDTKTSNMLAMAFDRKTGKELWRREIAVGYSSNKRNDLTAPSPVCDAERAIFFYGSGDLAAFAHDGKELWRRNLQKDHGKWSVQWLYGSSPLLFEGRLYVQVLQRAPDDVNPMEKPVSYLLAIDPATGKDQWKVMRPCEAKGETQESYATPIPMTSFKRAEILIVGGDCITGHDPETGKEFWRVGGWNPTRINHWRLVPSPVVTSAGIIVCPPKGGKIFSVSPGGNGDVTASNIAWTATDMTSDVCVPLYFHERLYVIDGDKKTLSCADPKTGKKMWTGDLGGNAVLRGSPTAADGKIYCTNEAGDVWSVAADEFKILSKLSLGGGNTTRASVALAYGQVFVRTNDKLYAFANKGSTVK